jgi:hypothetical protein
MKKLLTTLLMLAIAVGMSAQTKEAAQWMKRGEWRNGFTWAKPHKTLDVDSSMRSIIRMKRNGRRSLNG